VSTVLKLENGSKRGGSVVALRHVGLNVADNSYAVMFDTRGMGHDRHRSGL